MHKPTRLPLVFALGAALVTACGASPGEHSEGFGNSDPSGGGSSSSGGSSGSGGGGNLAGGDGGPTFGGMDGGSTTSSGTYTPPTALGCSTRAQDIVVFDFRSGWWTGGGGGDFAAVALPVVTSACPGTSVDYHHFENVMHVKCLYQSGSTGSCKQMAAANTVADILSTLEHSSVADYTQIWVLSGSDQDPSDIPVGDALFQGVLSATTGACIPMLVAAGDGFVTHANTVTNDLGMGTVFTEETTPPGFFSVAGLPAQPDSYLTGAQLSQHLLFKGVSSLVDTVKQQFGNATTQTSKSDSIAASVPGGAVYQVIAHDGSGNATIAVGAASVGSGQAPRPFIFDSGWQRTYGLGQNAATQQYVKNIVMYLSLVGCKAAPIAQ
ncbi:MAG TPA: hypothetical protein VF765_22030 [Polyangiaceae bacterium]